MRVRILLPVRYRLIATGLVLALLVVISALNNPVTTTAQVGTTTAVVGISKTATASPSVAEIDAAVRQAVALAGGLPDGIGPGKKVVIQPNLVNAGFYSGGGAIPNAAVVRTIIQMCLERGVQWTNIVVCEGSAGFYGDSGGYGSRQMTRKAFKDCGLDPDGDMLVETNGNHVAWCIDANYCGEYTGYGNVQGAYPNYPDYSGPYSTSYVTLYSKKAVPGVSTRLVPELNIDRVYALPNCIVNCDYLIRVPVLKNHNLAGVTGALKLAFGIAPSDIYHMSGVPNYKWNLLHYPDRWGRPEEDANARGMTDMTRLRPPDLVVMDGLVGVKNGPVGGADGGGGTLLPPDGGKMACIIASRDPVAVDTVEALACSYLTTSIYGLRRASEAGLGTNDPGKIEIRGVRVKDIRRAFPEWGCAVPANDPNPPQFNLSLPEGVNVCGRLDVTPSDCTDENDPYYNSTGLCKGELYVDGRLVDSNDQAPYTTSWVITNESEGAHTVTYTLYDKMLNESSESRTVYVYRKDPMAAAFGLADGSHVSLAGLVFTGSAPSIDGSTFFVSSPDGLRGLMVRGLLPAPTFALGQTVSVYGSMSTLDGQRFLNCISYSALGAGSKIRPRFMRNFDLGGTGYNGHTFGVTGGVGPYNVGCLVTTSGRVSAGSAGAFRIDDGSVPGIGTDAPGIEVRCGALSTPPMGSYVTVTGFSCCERSGVTTRRVLAMRSGSDWRTE